MIGLVLGMLVLATAAVAWRHHLKQRECRHKNAIIAGARQCISVADSGGHLPALDERAKKNLIDNYGEDWLNHEEELVQAMLAFVADLRIFEGPDGDKLRRYFVGDPSAVCLLNIFTCVEHLGVTDKPTLLVHEHNFAAFTASFGLSLPRNGQSSTCKPPSRNTTRELDLHTAPTGMIIIAAMSYALELREQQRAA